MRIELENLGKRFSRQWIFRKISYSFTAGNAYAIVGPNGSGKSTLLQVIAGAVEKSEGNIIFQDANAALPLEMHYKQISIAAPYIELIEELTLTEFLHFHHSFKPFSQNFSVPFIVDYIGLKAASNKQIRYFSSGMKQRVKLAQAIFSDVPVVLLDEPCTNLDSAGIALYQNLIERYAKNRLVIVSSNDEVEYGFCKERINMMEFK